MVHCMDIPFTVVSPLLPHHNKCPHLDFEPEVVYLDYSNMGSFLRDIQKEIAIKDIGVIDVQCNVYLGVLGMMLSQKTGIPLISSFHMNLEHPDHAEVAFFAAHKELIQQTINESDAIVCVSESVKESLLHFSPVTAPIHTVVNGVDTTVFCPRKKKENALLFVGRFSKEKNIPFLLKVYKEIAKKEDFKLWLVGDGPERKAIEVMAQKLGIASNIVYWGILTGNALAEVYAAAAVTVSPSVTEAFGMTTLESIACGTPVIASRTAGTNELLDKVKGGILFDVDNANGAVAAFYQLINEYDNYRQEGLNNVQKFAWGTVLSPLKELYKQYV